MIDPDLTHELLLLTRVVEIALLVALLRWVRHSDANHRRDVRSDERVRR